MAHFLLGFLLAILTFHVNHNVKKIFDIKVLINTMFDVFGNEKMFLKYDKEEVVKILLSEIINVEKLHDNNYYVKQQVQKLHHLRELYKNNTLNQTELSNINFKRLGRTFIILSILNLNPEYFIVNNEKNQ